MSKEYFRPEKGEPNPKNRERVFYRNEKEYQGLLTKINARFGRSIKTKGRALFFSVGLGIMGGAGFSLEKAYVENQDTAHISATQNDSERKNAEIAAFEKTIADAEGNSAISDQEKDRLHDLRREMAELQDSLGPYYDSIDFEPKQIPMEKSAGDLRYENIQNCKKLGINLEVLKKDIEEMPLEMRANVTSINFVDEIMPLGKQYGNKNAKEIVEANASWNEKTKRGAITFFRLGHEKWSKSGLKETINHEGAHLNDWSNAPWLSPAERIELAYAVMDRVRDKNRAQYGEVEDIKEKDARRKLYEQMTEYWAWTIQTYKTNPQQLPEADQEIVDQYMSHTKLGRETE